MHDIQTTTRWSLPSPSGALGATAPNCSLHSDLLSEAEPLAASPTPTSSPGNDQSRVMQQVRGLRPASVPPPKWVPDTRPGEHNDLEEFMPCAFSQELSHSMDDILDCSFANIGGHPSNGSFPLYSSLKAGDMPLNQSPGEEVLWRGAEKA